MTVYECSQGIYYMYTTAEQVFYTNVCCMKGPLLSYRYTKCIFIVSLQLIEWYTN